MKFSEVWFGSGEYSFADLLRTVHSPSRLCHPFLSLLKKIYSQFSSLSSLNCKSCQYAKLHLVHLSSRVNKRVSAPFESVHYDVWGSCPILSSTGFRYFVTFVDDFFRVTCLYLMKSRSELFFSF